MPRLFVGLPLPEAAREALGSERTRLAGARWVPPARYHLTLRFIGEVADELADRIRAELRTVAVPVVRITVAGLTIFPPRGDPRVLVARVEPAADLLWLQYDVGEALRHAGVEPDPRPFRPHITLARMNQADRHAVEGVERESHLAVDFVARSFVLWASLRTPTGARHAAIESYPLDDP